MEAVGIEETGVRGAGEAARRREVPELSLGEVLVAPPRGAVGRNVAERRKALLARRSGCAKHHKAPQGKAPAAPFSRGGNPFARAMKRKSAPDGRNEAVWQSPASAFIALSMSELGKRTRPIRSRRKDSDRGSCRITKPPRFYRMGWNFASRATAGPADPHRERTRRCRRFQQSTTEAPPCCFHASGLKSTATFARLVESSADAVIVRKNECEKLAVMTVEKLRFPQREIAITCHRRARKQPALLAASIEPRLSRFGYRKALFMNFATLYAVEGSIVRIARILHQSQDYARLV